MGTNTFKQRCPKTSHKFTNIKGPMNLLISNPIASELLPTNIFPTYENLIVKYIQNVLHKVYTVAAAWDASLVFALLMINNLILP